MHTETSETLSRQRRTSVADLADWLTKPEAAQAVGVSTKAIERFAQLGKLQQQMRPQATGHARVVYCPEDIARLAQARQRPAQPFVMPTDAALVPQRPRPTLRRIRDTSEMSQPRLSSMSPMSPMPLPWAVFTVKAAAAISGWTKTYLRRAIREGRLPATKDGGWKIRLKDLAKL